MLSSNKCKIKSPYTGKEIRASYEQDTWQFRNEEFKCYRLFWFDDDSGERFTTIYKNLN
ncbi:MAG: hypothetical protein IKI67_07870 [Bacteroidales bacterium]|nr:hypothetical protein [Bacteroidales bacterium]